MFARQDSDSQVSLPVSLERLVPVVLECAAQAVDRVRSGQYLIETKPDNSFVTTIDSAAHDFFLEKLPTIFKALVISEEGIPDLSLRQREKNVWIIDPIDNTKGLVESGNLDSSNINVVLAKDGLPVFGMTYYFMDSRGYIAIAGEGIREFSAQGIHDIEVPERSAKRLFVAYRPELSEMSETTRRVHELAIDPGDAIVSRNLLPLRLRALMEGAADVYIEPRSLNEWDVAPAFAAMNAIGGQGISLEDGQPVRLNSPGLKAPPFLLTRPGVDAREIINRIRTNL